MKIEFEKLLLTELNVVKYIPGDLSSITDADMTNALTVNENLKAFGYTLRPMDIVALAASKTRDELFGHIQELLPDVKAKPMYPDFPTQVMHMSEAMFRFHQALHYFSTYGVEFLTGVPVQKGWLSNVLDTDKTAEDTKLLELTVLELVPDEAVYEVALSRILRKRERMTIPETNIVKLAVSHVSVESLSQIQVSFKENLEILFDVSLEMDRDGCVRVLSTLCQHSGDVLKNIYRVLRTKNFHLRTAEKKTFVRLLESFPVADFRGNLMKSKNQREKNLLILQKLDFNSYAKCESHKAVVNQLRNDTLKSWEAIAKQMVTDHQSGALEFLAKRPGMMLRMMNWLLVLGYSEAEIQKHLCMQAENFSTHTLVQLITKFSSLTEESIHANAQRERSANDYAHRCQASKYNIWDMEWDKKREIENTKNRFLNYYRINKNKLDLERQKELTHCDIAELKRLEDAEIAYLEAPYYCEIKEMKQSYEVLLQKEKDLELSMNNKLRSMRKVVKERTVIRDSYYAYLVSIGEKENADCYYKNFQIADSSYTKMLKDRNALHAKIETLAAKMDSRKHAILERMNIELSEQKTSIQNRYSQLRETASKRAEEINASYNAKLQKLEAQNAGCKEACNKAIAEIEKRYERKMLYRESELERIEKDRLQKDNQILMRETSQIKQLHNLPAKRRILSEIIGAHFRCMETALMNKKVYLDLDAYDLEHSLMLGSDKSAEGGYIPSGIAYKIPDEATRVRFFVYWNDESRVDIDLHANGCTADGNSLHIGWNGDYNNCGVTHSGDITHSDAAEYIDVDLSKPVKRIYTNVHLFSGKEALNQVDECYVGMMAVDHIGEEVQLYDRANCYFAHEINQACNSLFYGYIDVENRFVRFIGRPNEIGTSNWQEDTSEDQFTLDKYLKLLYENQNVTLVDSPEEADVVLSMGKSIYANGISLIDENFFMDVM